MFNEFKKWLGAYWHWLILILISTLFFVGTSGFNYFTQSGGFTKWLSPDESANYNFTKLYAQTGRLTIFEKYNLVAEDIIHPRSYRSDSGFIKPVSFLGIILIYGQIAALTTYKIIPFLTPLFAALGIIFFYLLVKEIFDRRNALICALLLAVFPPYIYYSARSMFHNVLFMVLVLAGFYYALIAIRRTQSKKLEPEQGRLSVFFSYLPNLYIALSGALFGLAIIIRTSELLWLLPILLILWLGNFKKVGFIKLILFISFLFLALMQAFYYNQILYQSFWRGGYNEMNNSILQIAHAGTNIFKTRAATIQTSLQAVKNNIFYFGLNPQKSLKMLYYYFARMFYWLFWPAAVGFLLWLFRIKEWQKRHYFYLITYLIASAILIIYYGSWDFHDNPDPKSFTIGNSYVRYWLPVYLGAMPFAALLLINLAKLLRKKVLINVFLVLVMAGVWFISLKFVLFTGDEALIKSARNMQAWRGEQKQILDLTESRAVIITQYHDKLLFPERKVIVGLFTDPNMNKDYATLVKYLPVYYYNFTFREQDINFLNQSRLATVGLRIDQVAKITKDFTLYKLSYAEVKQ